MTMKMYDDENMSITMDIYKYQRHKMQDINTSEKASDSKLSLITRQL